MNGLSVRTGTRRARRTAATASFVAFALVLSACSGDDDDADDATAATEDGSDESETVSLSASGDLEALQAQLDEANATIEEQTQEISDLNAKIATAEEAAVDVQADLSAQTQRADTAEADLAALQTQVDEFSANFPVTITSSLDGFDVVGAYDMSLTEAFCDGIATCGAPRPVVRADIIQGPNGLELQVPNVLTTGLFLVEGSLFGATDSNLIVPPCSDGTPTNSQVSTTIFANAVDVALDGTKTIETLGASLFVAVNPAGSCGAGNVFFAATLTPV